MIQRIKVWEFIVVGVLLVITLLVALPFMTRSREAARRSSCANNLKQWGIVFKMYSNESRWGLLPPLSSRPNDWFVDLKTVCPEYLTDLGIAVCPDSPYASSQPFTLRSTFKHPNAHRGDIHPDCVTGRFYTYTGFALTSDESALALYLAYHANGARGLPDRDLTLPLPKWSNSPSGQHKIGSVLMWDRIPPQPSDAPHNGIGANVLMLTGAVQFVEYSPLNNPTKFPLTELATFTYGADYARTSSDCL